MSVNHFGPMRSMPQANRMRGKARYESAIHHRVKATYDRPMIALTNLPKALPPAMTAARPTKCVDHGRLAMASMPLLSA